MVERRERHYIDGGPMYWVITDDGNIAVTDSRAFAVVAELTPTGVLYLWPRGQVPEGEGWAICQVAWAWLHGHGVRTVVAETEAGAWSVDGDTFGAFSETVHVAPRGPEWLLPIRYWDPPGRQLGLLE